MPTREYKRHWCKTCNDWQLFEMQYPNKTDWFCEICENKAEAVPLKDIPVNINRNLIIE